MKPFKLSIQQQETGDGTPYVAWQKSIEIVEVTSNSLIDSNGLIWNRKTGYGMKCRKKTTWFIPLDELELLNNKDGINNEKT